MIQSNEQNLEKDLKDGLNILEFYTEYCVPCRELIPILDSLSKEFNINVLKINATENKSLIKRFKIMSSPTMVFLKNNEVLNIIRGIKTENQLAQIIKEYI